MLFICLVFLLLYDMLLYKPILLSCIIYLVFVLLYDMLLYKPILLSCIIYLVFVLLYDMLFNTNQFYFHVSTSCGVSDNLGYFINALAIDCRN